MGTDVRVVLMTAPDAEVGERLATTLVSAIAMVARENNMPAIYLQVSGDNADGIAFWERLGFSVHHEYTYLAKPDAPKA